MSEINIHGTEEVYGKVMPGVTLVRLVDARTPFECSSYTMDSGHWGLTISNDPCVAFEMDPVNTNTESDDEFFGMMPVGNHYYKQIRRGSLNAVSRLTLAAVEAGYDINEDGCLAFWICQRMWEHLESCGWKPAEVLQPI